MEESDYDTNKENENPVASSSKYSNGHELNINQILRATDEPDLNSQSDHTTGKNRPQVHYFKSAALLMQRNLVRPLSIRRSISTDIDHFNGIKNYSNKVYLDAYLSQVKVEKIKVNPNLLTKYLDAEPSLIKDDLSIQTNMIFRGYFDQAYHSHCVDYLSMEKKPIDNIVLPSANVSSQWKECSIKQSNLSQSEDIDVIGFTLVMNDEDGSIVSSLSSSSQMNSNLTDGQQGDDEGEKRWTSVKNSSMVDQIHANDDPRYFVCDSSNLPMTPTYKARQRLTPVNGQNEEQQAEEISECLVSEKVTNFVKENEVHQDDKLIAAIDQQHNDGIKATDEVSKGFMLHQSIANF